jgi:hypothetical protein
VRLAISKRLAVNDVRILFRPKPGCFSGFE